MKRKKRNAGERMTKVFLAVLENGSLSIADAVRIAYSEYDNENYEVFRSNNAGFHGNVMPLFKKSLKRVEGFGSEVSLVIDWSVVAKLVSERVSDALQQSYENDEDNFSFREHLDWGTPFVEAIKLDMLGLKTINPIIKVSRKCKYKLVFWTRSVESLMLYIFFLLLNEERMIRHRYYTGWEDEKCGFSFSAKVIREFADVQTTKDIADKVIGAALTPLTQRNLESVYERRYKFTKMKYNPPLRGITSRKRTSSVFGMLTSQRNYPVMRIIELLIQKIFIASEEQK